MTIGHLLVASAIVLATTAGFFLIVLLAYLVADRLIRRHRPEAGGKTPHA